MRSTWILRSTTSLLWALAAGCAVLWGLRMTATGSNSSLPPAASSDFASDAGSRQSNIARLLGATNSVAVNAQPAPVVSRFSLNGVVAQGSGGVALLVVDGKPAKPYRVGSAIDEATVLQSVGPRFAVLAASMGGPELQRLEMPSASASNSAAKAAMGNGAAVGMPSIQPTAPPNTTQPNTQPKHRERGGPGGRLGALQK